MIDDAATQHRPITIAVDNNVCTTSETLDETLRFPWTEAPEKECPEELETELPSSLSYALHYMEMTVEDALEEYQQALLLQVAPAFAAATDILDLMKTKGAQVFIPRNWEGFHGIPPLVLA
jgi:hypothetical protein